MQCYCIMPSSYTKSKIPFVVPADYYLKVFSIVSLVVVNRLNLAQILQVHCRLRLEISRFYAIFLFSVGTFPPMDELSSLTSPSRDVFAVETEAINPAIHFIGSSPTLCQFHSCRQMQVFFGRKSEVGSEA